MRVPDHYAALGIQETADASDIRKAYKKRALQTHPDKGGDEEEFKRVGAAYAVLSDEEKRRDYDEMRTDGLRQGERDQTDYQCTGFNSAFDAPFFGQRWDPGEKFSMDDARAQFDRFFGTQSPFANLIDAQRAQGDADLDDPAAGRSDAASLIIHLRVSPCQRDTSRRPHGEHGSTRSRAPRTSTSSSTRATCSTAAAATSLVDLHTGLPPTAAAERGPGEPVKPVEERREKKGMTPLQMVRCRRRFQFNVSRRWRRAACHRRDVTLASLTGGCRAHAPEERDGSLGGAPAPAQRDGPAGPRALSASRRRRRAPFRDVRLAFTALPCRTKAHGATAANPRHRQKRQGETPPPVGRRRRSVLNRARRAASRDHGRRAARARAAGRPRPRPPL